MDEETKKEIQEMIATSVATAVGEATKQMMETLKNAPDHKDPNEGKDLLDRDLSDDEVNKLSEGDKIKYLHHRGVKAYIKEMKEGSSLKGKDI